jgi:hypothetical protein
VGIESDAKGAAEGLKGSEARLGCTTSVMEAPGEALTALEEKADLLAFELVVKELAPVAAADLRGESETKAEKDALGDAEFDLLGSLENDAEALEDVDLLIFGEEDCDEVGLRLGATVRVKDDVPLTEALAVRLLVADGEWEGLWDTVWDEQDVALEEIFGEAEEVAVCEELGDTVDCVDGVWVDEGEEEEVGIVVETRELLGENEEAALRDVEDERDGEPEYVFEAEALGVETWEREPLAVVELQAVNEGLPVSEVEMADEGVPDAECLAEREDKGLELMENESLEEGDKIEVKVALADEEGVDETDADGVFDAELVVKSEAVFELDVRPDSEDRALRREDMELDSDARREPDTIALSVANSVALAEEDCNGVWETLCESRGVAETQLVELLVSVP